MNTAFLEQSNNVAENRNILVISIHNLPLCYYKPLFDFKFTWVCCTLCGMKVILWKAHISDVGQGNMLPEDLDFKL